MTAAIVILNYNSSKVTIKYLNEITSQCVYDYIIVVDNNSKEDEVAMLSEYCRSHNIELLIAEENRGYSAGNNLGVKYAIHQLNADVVFISNPDIICPIRTIERIKQVIRESEDTGLVTGVVHVFDKERIAKPYKYFAYKTPSYTDMVLNSFYLITKMRMKMHRSMYYSLNSFNQQQELEVGCVSGCFFAIKGSAYNRINGFDEDTFLYYEEAILGYRLQKAGYKEIVVNVPVYHDEDPTKRRGLRKLYQFYLINQSSAKIYLKKYLKINAIQMVIYRVCASVGFFEQVVLNQIVQLRNRKTSR